MKPYASFALTILSVAALAISSCAQPPTVGCILTYEIEPGFVDTNASANLPSIVEQVNRRLGTLGIAAIANPTQFEVQVFGKPSTAELDILKRRIAGMAKFELRICADPRLIADRPIIEQATTLSPDAKVVSVDGEPRARWVQFSEAEFGPVDRHDERIVTRLAGNVPEALVLMDPWNVTGEYLAGAAIGVSNSGKRVLLFELNHQGAGRLKQLTTTNQANIATGAFRLLGLVFDDRLMCAPAIAQPITSPHFEIDGSKLTEAEMQYVVDLIHEGTLSAPIRLVAERTIDAGESTSAPNRE